jgi:hypothetical protein
MAIVDEGYPKRSSTPRDRKASFNYTVGAPLGRARSRQVPTPWYERLDSAPVPQIGVDLIRERCERLRAWASELGPVRENRWLASAVFVGQ